MMNVFFDLDKLIFKKIRHAIMLNKKAIDYPGKKIYYSAAITKLTFAFPIQPLIGSIYLLFDSSKNDLDIFSLFTVLMWLFFILNMFHKVIFKQLVFIINGDQLYYTKLDKWFDLKNKVLYEGAVERSNLWGTLIIELEYWEDSIHENLWYIEYDKEFIKLMEKYFKKSN